MLFTLVLPFTLLGLPKLFAFPWLSTTAIRIVTFRNVLQGLIDNICCVNQAVTSYFMHGLYLTSVVFMLAGYKTSQQSLPPTWKINKIKLITKIYLHKKLTKKNSHVETTSQEKKLESGRYDPLNDFRWKNTEANRAEKP